MIHESETISRQCLWFTSLVSKSATLLALYQALRNVKALDIKTIEMAQGQKVSRFVAWTFHNVNDQKMWKKDRWKL